MSRISSHVLIDRTPGGRTYTTDAIWIGTFSLVTAVCAQISFHLPFTPVPVTGQTFAVLLSGIVLGWRRGFLSQLVYLAEGAAGLPVFADASGTALHLMGPAGGYLWSFPLAAALVGWLAQRGAVRSSLRLAGALLAADMLILTVGSLWLCMLVRAPYGQAWRLGFYPFLILDTLKIALVGLLLPRLLRWIETRKEVPPFPPRSN